MIYVDLRYSFAVARQSGKFNGGNNYAQNILRLLLKEFTDILIICDSVVIKDYLVKHYSINDDCILVQKKLSEINFEKESVYYNPQAQDSRPFLEEIKRLKKEYPAIKIKMTIHDRRHHEDIFDKYNGVLNVGIKSNHIILGIGRFINSIRKDRIVKQLLALSDDVYTVSNYSMQELLKLGNPRSISYYTQSIGFYEDLACETENYILFVSAGRSEKNFIRALKAFEEYVKKSENREIRLKVTGLNEQQMEIIKSSGLIDEKILNNQVELLGYLNNDEFAVAYAKSRFLLFTSKSEGFGLPVSEAMFFEKPVVASRRSSIPEAMSSAAIYVDPYSVGSIAFGIEQMMEEDIYKQEIIDVKKKKKIWQLQVELDNKILIDRIGKY